MKSLLSNRNQQQEDLEIENLCMAIASFQASGHLTAELQSLILKKVESNLPQLDLADTAKLFATISRYASGGE